MNEELDELVSAYVDGEATPEEMVRVEADPELLELADEFRGLRLSNLPTPVPAAGLREEHLAAALAAHHTPAVAPSEPAQSNVVPLGDAARRRTGSWLAKAAAAVIVVAGAGLALTQLPRSGEDVDTASVLESDGADEIELPGSASASQVQAEESASSPAEDRASVSDQTELESGEAEAAAEAFGADDDASEATPAGGLSELDGTETSAELLDLVIELAIEPEPVRASACFTVIDTEFAGQGLGVIDLVYGGVSAQLLIYDNVGEPTATLVGPDCEILSTD